jgi:hypothetical protein
VKIGDLVKRRLWKDIEYNPTESNRLMGIIIESGVYAGRKDVKVMWASGINTEKSHKLEVISEEG